MFVNLYRNLAEWSAVIERLSGFDKSVAAAQAVAVTPPVIGVAAGEAAAVSFKDLAVRLPNGVPLINASDISIGLGERVLVSGPSGAGKSTLFRALAGIWPFGAGTITVPKNARLMILPQRPYFPIAPLAAAVAYPAEPGTFDDARVAELIAAVGLPALAARIEEEAHWNRMLSLGEQQRLGIARALLHAPDYLFLDEATASLDEPSEAALYSCWNSGLPPRPSYRSVTARRLPRSTAAGWRSAARATATGCAKAAWRRRRSGSHGSQPIAQAHRVLARCAPAKKKGGGSLRAAARRSRRGSRLDYLRAEIEVSNFRVATKRVAAEILAAE